MNYGMRLFQNCLTQLTVEFIEYCKKEDIELTERPQFLIRRNISVNPISKILKTYDKVMEHGVNFETAKFANYLEEQVLHYLFLAKPISPTLEACLISYRNIFFDRILRKRSRDARLLKKWKMI